jgi:hypothetical protein
VSAPNASPLAAHMGGATVTKATPGPVDAEVTWLSRRVPYVIAWSGEAVEQPLAFMNDAGESRRDFCEPMVFLRERARLSYVDPHPSDWVNGLLRARVGQDRSGEPLWRMLNTHRQWLCMMLGLCQVCGESAMDLETSRMWWVITETAFRATDAGEGLTNAPPTCPACIPESLALCPQLRKSSAVYTAAHAEPVGVLADVFFPSLSGGVAPVGHNVFVGFDEMSRHSRVLATQLVVRLMDMTPESI